MKSIQGLIIALALGIVAALLNLAYVNSQVRDAKTMVDYIGVADGQTVLRGEPLTEAKLVKVPIPLDRQGTLDRFAFRWSDLRTVVGRPVTRTLSGGSLLLEDDMRTPPAELELPKPKPGSQDEDVALFVPVDMRAFVPSLVKPGDRVSFLVGSGRPTPAGGSTGSEAEQETIGPFVVLALGSRLSSEEVAKAATVSASQQNILTIRVRRVAGRFEDKAQRLLGEIDRTSSRGLGVILHPRD